ncbi:MAG: alpha-amylase, partial [Hyphomicrobiales bacterium]|nr:alpha-amylase [Hyphomicrobiales bacterium]
RWDGSEKGGFTTGEPWLPMGNTSERNIDRQRKEPHSLLWLYRRRLDDIEIAIGLNLVHEPRRWEWQGAGTLLLSTHLDREEQPLSGPILLRADEGVIVRLKR